MAGELAALLTAMCWTITSIVFESASRRIGAITVNLLRLYLAFLVYMLVNYIFQGSVIPFHFSAGSWLWLIGSGMIGFVLGDHFLFKAFETIGARIAMLIMSFVPAISAVLSYAFLQESLSVKDISGIIITTAGIIMVVLRRKPGNKNNTMSLHFSFPVRGIVYAFIGAAGQAGGLLLSKIGMGTSNPFQASEIRVIGGMAGFTLLYFLMGNQFRIQEALHDKKTLGNLSAGTLFGPFLGVSLSLTAIKHTQIGVASTIMAIVPVLVIIPSILIFKEKVRIREVIGAFIAIAGIAFLFLN